MTRGFGRFVVRYRFAVVAAWAAIAVVAALALPEVEKGQPSPLGGLIPSDSDAVKVAERSAELFRFPVLADTIVVQRNPDGLGTDAQIRVFERALRLTRDPDPQATGIVLILPATNVRSVFPGSRENGTTAVSYLFVKSDRSARNRYDLARFFAFKYVHEPGDALVGVTGAVPAQLEQAAIIKNSLPDVELWTLVALAVIVALAFRSPGAPVMALSVAALANLVAVRSIAALGRLSDVTVPTELEPLVLVLLLAIVVDYSIFFLWDFRLRLRSGESRAAAAADATSATAHIVLTAGLIVAAGALALLAGRLDFFRTFGPGLALTALVGVVVSVTLIPALLAIFGRSLFWPTLGHAQRPTLHAPARELGHARRARARGALVTRLALRRPMPALIVVTAALAAAGAGLAHIQLGITLIRGLPADTEPRRAALAASQGFVPGILAPTELLVERPGVTGERASLTALEFLLERQPGVAAVVGPRENPSGRVFGAVLSPTGNAARYIVVLAGAPLGARGIEQLRDLERALPTLMRQVGLGDAITGFSGATALASETVASTVDDLRRIALAAGLVNVFLLAVFLRSLVAPLYLLATSVLALAASLGLTTFVFQDLLGNEDLTYYVPFIAAVLLLSLGSDYNVFVVGRIWQAARDRPLREAVALAAPSAAKAVSVAGIGLATSFALLAIVPLQPFRELAFAMSVGVLIETFVVRAALVPAFVAVFGSLSRWPARRKATGGPAADLAASPLGERHVPIEAEEARSGRSSNPEAGPSRSQPSSPASALLAAILVLGLIWAARRARSSRTGLGR